MNAATIIQTILGSLTAFLTGMGSAIVGFFTEITTDGDGGLSDMAVWLLVFLGVALAIGVARLVFAIFRTRR